MKILYSNPSRFDKPLFKPGPLGCHGLHARFGGRSGGGGGGHAPRPLGGGDPDHAQPAPAGPALPGHVGLPAAGRHRPETGRRLVSPDTVSFPATMYTNLR